MVNRSHLAAPRYELPDGYVDAVAFDEPLIKEKPNVLDVSAPSQATVTKTDLAQRVSERTGFGRSLIDTAVSAVFEEMAKALEEGAKVSVRGFGAFETAREDSNKLYRKRTLAKRLKVNPRRLTKNKAKLASASLRIKRIDFRPSATLFDRHIEPED